MAPPHYLPHHNHVRHSTTTSPVPTLHHQEGSTTARSLSQNFTDRTVLQNLWRFFSPTRHTTSPHHSNHTTIVVCWQLWCGKVVVVRGVMWLLATFPPQPRPPQRTTTSPGNHEHTPPPAGRSTLARSTCHKTSQIKLCCRTSGDFFGLSKSTEEEGSLRFLSFTQPFFSPTRHTTSPHHHLPHSNRGVLESLWCGQVAGRKGDVTPPHYLPTPQPGPPQRTTTSPGNHQRTPHQHT